MTKEQIALLKQYLRDTVDTYCEQLADNVASPVHGGYFMHSVLDSDAMQFLKEINDLTPSWDIKPFILD